MATVEELLGSGDSIEEMLGLPPPQRGRRTTGGIEDVLASSQQAQNRQQRKEPEEGQQPGMSTRAQRRQMLEDEAWQLFLGEMPKKPPMKLRWNEILAGALSPKLLPGIFERKMQPYYEELEGRKAKQQALDMMLGAYRERGPISTGRGLYDPERGQVIPGTEPLPKEEKEARPQYVPGRGLMDPESRQFIPGTEPPPKPREPKEPKLQYVPGRGLFDTSTRKFIPDTAGAKPGTVDKQNAEVLREGRRRYNDALKEAEQNIRIREGIFGQALNPEQRKEAIQQAESEYSAYVGKFAERKDLEARLEELLASGMNEEEAYGQLEVEGYE